MGFRFWVLVGVALCKEFGDTHTVWGKVEVGQRLKSGRTGVSNQAGVCMVSQVRWGQRAGRGWAVEVSGW